MSIRTDVYKMLDALQEQNFSKEGICKEVAIRTGIRPVPRTIMKYCREYADISGACLVCFNKRAGIYHYRPGFLIESAILQGKE